MAACRLAARRLHTTSCVRGHAGSRPIPIQSGVRATLGGAQNEILTVAGPLGTERVTLPAFVTVDISGTDIRVAPSDAPQPGASTSRKDEKWERSQWGLVRSQIANLVKGMTTGFESNLRLVGVGYRAVQETGPEGQLRLRMKLGFSHDIVMDVPAGVTVEVSKPTEMVLRGTDNRRVSQFAANIRKWRPPEPYNGKGVFINGETIKLKDVVKR